jgi:ribosome biogenesis GTPase
LSDIFNYGFNGFFEKQISESEKASGLIPARIIEVHREVYKVRSDLGTGSARLKGSIFYSEDGNIDYPAIGDFVLIKHNGLDHHIIHRVLERKSYFSRKDPDKGRGEQIVATNFDYVFIMLSLNYDFNIGKMERYIATAWQSKATPVVVLTKADLCVDPSEQINSSQQVAIGVDVIPISTYTGLGMDRINEYMQPGKTFVLLGSSGVGKSSLVNALLGDDVMKVNDIREDDSRGRHTTTHRQLIELDNHVMIIDTPGMRELGMWDASIGISEAFSDIEDFVSLCKFHDCKHNLEPDCAVREALRNGSITESRWNNYLKLQKEIRYAQKREKDNKKKSQSMKKFSKSQRSGKGVY